MPPPEQQGSLYTEQEGSLYEDGDRFESTGGLDEPNDGLDEPNDGIDEPNDGRDAASEERGFAAGQRDSVEFGVERNGQQSYLGERQHPNNANSGLCE